MKPGNRLRLLIDGRRTREVMLDAIRSARERVWLESFMVIPDEAGREVISALEEAAERGVEVIVVADLAASPFFALGWHRGLCSAGASVVLYNPIPPWGRWGKRVASILHRDHRKILITDETGYCGGHNIGKTYLDSGKGTFFDATLEVQGPCVTDLAKVFVQTLEQSSHVRPRSLPEPGPFEDGVPAAVEMMDRKHGIESAQDALYEVLRGARERVNLMIAYFLPERQTLEELKATARRGVDLTILTAGKTDLPFVRAAANTLYGELLDAGVQIHELWEQKLHAKCVVADGEHVIVGTFDYNRFSAQHSLEVSLSTHSPELGAQLEGIVQTNLERSKQITPEYWHNRGALRRLWHRTSFASVDAAAKRGR